VLGNLIPVPMGPSTVGVSQLAANTCEAQLAFIQIFPMAALYVYGIVREVKLRRLFLSAKHPHLMGASRWPLDGNQVLPSHPSVYFCAYRSPLSCARRACTRPTVLAMSWRAILMIDLANEGCNPREDTQHCWSRILTTYKPCYSQSSYIEEAA
jgi:hypothetical protein